MAKRYAVYGYTLEEVREALRKTPFTRDSSKKQYKTVNGKRFYIFCGCDAEKVDNGFEGITENFMLSSCIPVHTSEYCPKCDCWCYIDLTPLLLPER